MHRYKFKAYFLKKASSKQGNDQGKEDVYITKVVWSATKVATGADVLIADDEIKNHVLKKGAYQSNISEKIKREIDIYMQFKQVSTNSDLKRFSAKYAKIKLHRTTVNNGKYRLSVG